MLKGSLLHLAVAALALDCTALDGSVSRAAPTSISQPPRETPDTTPKTARPPPEAFETAILLTDAAVLQGLDGVSLGEVVFGQSVSNTAGLAAFKGYRDVVAAIGRELDARARADPRAGVGIRYAHRLFDRDWLASPDTRFELVAVSNRLDRRPFAPNHCGEVRLIYRLAYDASRLPMTVNIVFWQDGPDCTEVAQRWRVPPAMHGRLQAKHWQHEEGPLAPSRLGPAAFKSLEINLQSVRWPSVVHPSLGGHAEYLLKAFQRQGEGFVEARLENTPDVPRLRAAPAMRAELLAWLRDPEQRAALDAGVLRIPDAYLATSATSVTPRGFARVANRPFSQLFDPADFEDLAGGEAWPHTVSPVAVLRRLDGLTCGGCHESRSVAGFHVLGEDPVDQKLDALVDGVSPHVLGDRPRRQAYVESWARGESPLEARPLSEFDLHPGALGSHCGGGDPGFSTWTCAEGLECSILDDPEMGTCLPASPRAGSPCEVGRVRSHAHGERDRVRDVEARECGPSAVCNGNRVGFPQGMCTSSCAALGPQESCGLIVALTPFNHCIARSEPFGDCVVAHGSPAGMAACDAAQACRDDYICARSPNDSRGMCIPPYFLFQLRVDGHPPVRRLEPT